MKAPKFEKLFAQLPQLNQPQRQQVRFMSYYRKECRI